MDSGIIVGLLGPVLAIAALVLIFVFRDTDREGRVRAVETRLEAFNKTADQIIVNASSVAKEVQEIRSSYQALRPELSVFLATQWRYITQRQLVLDELLPIAGPTRVRVIILLPEKAETEEIEWLRAAATSPAFDFLKEPEEDLYTLADGRPFH